MFNALVAILGSAGLVSQMQKAKNTSKRNPNARVLRAYFSQSR